eukprot:3838337-Rhodomonas_salina.1
MSAATQGSGQQAAFGYRAVDTVAWWVSGYEEREGGEGYRAMLSLSFALFEANLDRQQRADRGDIRAAPQVFPLIAQHSRRRAQVHCLLHKMLGGTVPPEQFVPPGREPPLGHH